MKIFGYSFRSLIPGFVAAIGVAVVGGVVVGAFVLSGAISVAATYGDPKILYYALHTTFKNSVAWRATEDVPEDLDDEGRIALGAQHYANACAKCHGGPGLGQNPQALAMRPRPQHLAAVVDQFEDGELHYILDAGVRMSAMPAWPTSGREDEIWNVVAFIRQLPEMSADEYIELLQDQELAVEPQSVAYGERGPLIDNGIDDDPNQDRWPEEEYAYQSPATEWRDFAVQGDVVQRCAACHGGAGAGEATNGRAPNLTVLSGDYIQQALTDYASGSRKSGIMQIVASNLSAQQRVNLGEYYDSLPDQATEIAYGGDIGAGEEIATTGKLLSAVPACVTCHNNGDVGDGRVASLDVPELAGQSPIYIEQQLRLFRAGIREGGAAWKPMQYIASQLTDEDMVNLAAYFSAQEVGADIQPTDRLADASIDAGAEVVQLVCKECHTEQGIGSQSGDTPNLSLQGSDYLHQQLIAFREDIRKNSSQMRQTARQISLDDIANVAAYFGAQDPIAVSRDSEVGDANSGADIATYGLEEVGVPSCLTCHGPNPTEEIGILPRLHGQNQVYIEQRLDYFAGDSGNDVYGLSPMHRIASAMTEDQRADVAAWFAAQEPLVKN
ncbi:Cytochrome c4 precursor [Rhodobacteraceae bacterium THAF1]|uniref:c-type cytochrome n=1 Tax=Palleronia sp. THAF1 TaxID=2587842 RepID=UPI000F400B09|nr:c-type cytochrome [Palleronia sp. THAF1]QFU07673.1 Cytochrome c4 precursor [Palleronia sp. THAF1]VDC23124.1 Cytochrome c4 precursor [Rhodobacteraceae bacterium THAF1]